jgi:hypothetical protein
METSPREHEDLEAALSLPRAARSAGFTIVAQALKPCMNVVCPSRPHLLSNIYCIATLKLLRRYYPQWNLTWSSARLGQREQGIKCMHSAMRQLFAGQSRISRSRSQVATNQRQFNSSMSLLASLAFRLVHVHVDERGHLSTNIHHCDLPSHLTLRLACFAI